MKTIQENYTDFKNTYPLEFLHPSSDKILFLDIETTGFSAAASQLYLIGCSYFTPEGYGTCQWMAENPEEEGGVLTAFFEFASDFECLIHFNGSSFDLPFLVQKCTQHNLSYNFLNFQSIDIYRKITPYKTLLNLPNLKQKTVERFLEIDRDDSFDGGELINLYLDYVQNPSEDIAELLLLHNSEDLQGMMKLLPVLSYCSLFEGNVRARKVQANYYNDYQGKKKQELLMTLTLNAPLPKPVSFAASDCYLKAEEKEAVIKVPIYEEEMKYFYANYKDYYYLPEEDIALHKSVAGFVDKEHRVPAAAATCYTRKESQYLPQWDCLVTPFFKRDYKDKELFFELTDELKKNRTAFTRYAAHILTMIEKCCS